MNKMTKGILSARNLGFWQLQPRREINDFYSNTTPTTWVNRHTVTLKLIF